MEELLQIVKLLIQGNLLQFTKTLMEAMLKTCKLPRYAYGSPGGLGYYHAQLNDIVQYPDARTELFHNFRELGDIILFCLLMEQTLVGNVQIVHTGAFQNILPRPFCKGKNSLHLKLEMPEKYSKYETFNG
ncbi:Cytoplasmic FMR1-interacting protein 1 [Capsicum chinense]|nr:Cytoplasmic FMR1-interacting protein 1 [Capsicum chinense]